MVLENHLPLAVKRRVTELIPTVHKRNTSIHYGAVLRQDPRLARFPNPHACVPVPVLGHVSPFLQPSFITLSSFLKSGTHTLVALSGCSLPASTKFTASSVVPLPPPAPSKAFLLPLFSTPSPSLLSAVAYAIRPPRNSCAGC